MKQTFTFLALTALLSPLSNMAQGIRIDTKDPAVSLMEANRKTSSPFIVQFNESASYKEGDAQTLFTKYLSLRTGTDELRLKTRDADQDNIAVTRYQQYFNNIKVEHGGYTVTSKNGKVAFMAGDFYTIPQSSNTQPALAEADALSKALSFKHADVYQWEVPSEEGYIKKMNNDPAATWYPKGELVMVEDFMENGALTGKVFLAWRFDVYAHAPMSRTNIYVDAVSGKILMADEVIKHLHNEGQTADASNETRTQRTITTSKKDLFSPLATGTADTRYSGTVSIPTRLVGANYQLVSTVATEAYPLHTLNLGTGSNYGTATEFNDADNNWTAAEFDNGTFDNVALDAHWGAAKVYDYWKNRHGRLSYNNANAVIFSYVHLNVNYNNAFWNGTGMSYGDGSRTGNGFLPLGALDVCGHEIGHAVCSYTCNLAYNRESGGMNEGLSDIWGAAIEHYSDPFESDAVAKSYFDIGEEIGLPLPTPLRSMSNPKAHGQPDTYLKTNWVDATVAGCPTPDVNANDYCGVHTNSGVLNHWFYYMVLGGSGTNDIPNTFVVGALGWLKAEKVVYLTEQNLSSTSDYNAARTVSIAAATTLYGPACSADVENVTHAWYAVGVGADFVPCTPQVGFKTLTSTVTETSGSNLCPASKTITIPMGIVGGAAPAGGNATVTVTASGTATSGQDYTLGTATATFNAGSTTDQNITLNILEDAAVEGTETIVLDFAVTQNGSNLAKSGAYQQLVISLTDDDAAPESGNNTVSTGTLGTYSSNLPDQSIFKSGYASGRTQYIFTAAELTALGLKPNYPITNLYFYTASKNSTIPFSNFNVNMGTVTAATTSANPYKTGLTNVYSGSYTTVLGTNNIPLTTAFSGWDGTTNIVIEACFTNAAAGSANDVLKGYSASTTMGYSTGSATGCSLPIGFTSSGKPLISFTQQVPATAVEVTAASTRVAQVSSGQSTYFYSTADNQLIAGITGNNQDLGCVTATVAVSGAGFSTLSSFPAAKRSAKEVTITPTTNGSTVSYTAKLYYTTAELTGVTPANLYILKTSAATDAGITAGNTVLHVPSVGTENGYKSFSSSFTGFSRFFLVDNAFVVALKTITAEAYLNNGFATIRWTTAQESNSTQFVIERSYDGNYFTDLKQVPAAGNSSTERQYSTQDADRVERKTYYRVKLLHTDGSLAFSNIVSVKSSTEAGISIVPNPVKDQFMLSYDHAGKGMISIIDATGRKIKSLQPAGSSGTMTIDAGRFTPGVYLVMFSTDDNKIISEKFIKE